jgi:hypothetical protein
MHHVSTDMRMRETAYMDPGLCTTNPTISNLVWMIMCYHIGRFFNHKQGQISDLADIVSLLNIFSHPPPPPPPYTNK